MKKLPFVILLLLTACIPDGVRDQINENVAATGRLVADLEFKKAVSYVELHKLRNGRYPNTLSDLQFLSQLDSSIFKFVEYHRLDSGYELNMLMEMPSFGTKDAKKVSLRYPAEFWKGLGCIKSNTMISAE